MSDPNASNNSSNSENQKHHAAQEERDAKDEKTVDSRDLVYGGGYSKHPREIVENPAVTPQMLDEPQESRAGFIREDRDEAEQ